MCASLSRCSIEESSCIRGGSIYAPDFSSTDNWSFPVLTRPEKLSQNPLEISACDPPRKTEPEPVGDFGLRGSVCARLAGTVAVNVTQVMASSKGLETGTLVRSLLAAVVRWECGKREAFSKAALSPSLCAVHVRQFEGASPLSNLMEVKD
jgi:hypothetical protein